MPADTDRFCQGCNYNLHGLPEHRCPECGRVFNPDDPSTFVHTKPLGPITKSLARPIGWPTNGAAMLIVLLGLAASLYPGGMFWLQASCFLAWLAVGIVFFLRLLAFAWIRSSHRFRIDRDDNHPRWLIVPACLILWIVIVCTDVPARTFFFLNKPALDRFAQSTVSAPPGTKFPDRSIGLYPATHIESFPGGVRFLVKGAGFLDSCGFAYSPNSPPPNITGEDIYQRITSAWYIWREDW